MLMTIGKEWAFCEKFKNILNYYFTAQQAATGI